MLYLELKCLQILSKSGLYIYCIFNFKKCNNVTIGCCIIVAGGFEGLGSD